MEKKLFSKSNVCFKGLRTFRISILYENISSFCLGIYLHVAMLMNVRMNFLSFHTRLASQYQHFRVQLEMHTNIQPLVLKGA